MSISSIQDVANLQYGALYIPVASWFYIFHQTQAQTAYYALPVVILGATITHGIFYSIFGYEGPKHHPKKTFTFVSYSLALMYTRNPGGNPDTIEEFYNRLYDSFKVRRGIRFVVLLTVTTIYILLTVYSLKPLYELSTTGSNLIAGVLFLTQTIFLIQGRMMNRFAHVLPPEEAEWVWVPEYRRVNEVYSEDEYEDNEYQDPPLVLNDIRERLNYFRTELEIQATSEREEPE